MSTDPTSAAQALVALAEKDRDETVCRYPECHQPRLAASSTGRRNSYCADSRHNAVTNHRERRRLYALAAGNDAVPTATTRQEPLSPTTPPVESLRTSVVSGILQLQQHMEHYLQALTALTDPDLAAAQIRETLDRAEARVAEAHQQASTERSLRLAADTARLAAQEEAHAEREAAEEAIAQMEEAEARRQSAIEEAEAHKRSVLEDAERRIVASQAERDSAIEHIREEALLEREAIQRQAEEAINQAQTARAAAEEQARQADIRAHNVEAQANAQSATAERLVSEARATVERERAEVDRLRAELTFARTQAEQAAVRSEADRTEARATLERERAEVDRLRAQVDHLRTEMERLRAQVISLRPTERDTHSA